MFGSADAFIDQRLALGRVVFPLADLVKETGLSVTAARNQLLRLENAKVVSFLNGNYRDFLTEFEAIAAAAQSFFPSTLNIQQPTINQPSTLNHQHLPTNPPNRSGEKCVQTRV
jgi:hypothetical protein